MNSFTETQLPDRVIAGIACGVTRLDWNYGGTSYEVHRLDTGEDLTEESCFDFEPTDQEILDLLTRKMKRVPWLCPGCHKPVDPDLVADHVRDCDLVDGSGQRI